MNIETNKPQQQQQQQQHHHQQEQFKHQKQQQQYQQQQHQHPHHAHCSYDKDIVCDDAQMHKQKHQHHSHQPHAQSQCEKNKCTEIHQHQHQQHQPQQQTHQHRSKQQQDQQQPTSSLSHRHHQHHSQTPSHSHSQAQQRKYSHSPHQSRHTSPHSHHSHSLHSSPHQSHQHVNGSIHGGSGGLGTDTLDTRHSSSHRPSTQSSATHAHHHHHHRRRSRRNHTNGNGSGGGSGGGSGNSSLHGPHTGHSHNSQERSSGSRHHNSTCARRHRSATDISSVSLNTCHNENCIDREVQEIFVRKSCCSASRTELAQYFAEDLYGSSRRPSSCCTSSDYCYQTDSTSLYGSRSSLSRNNSIKSASISMRKKRALHQRQPSYTSISLHGIQPSQPCSGRQQQHSSLTTVFDRQKSKSAEAKRGEHMGGGRVVLSPSKVTIERPTSKDRHSQELPDYACSPSPSPARWGFLADEKIHTEMEAWKTDNSERPPKPPQPRKPCRQSKQDQTALSTKDERPSTAHGTARKRRESAFSCEFEESSTTVLFHQEGEAYNNCCNNYIQCNTYLDQDLQITSEDIHQYLSKGNRHGGDILNNSKNYPFQPSNALEFHYKNNFANNNNTTGSGTGTGTGTNNTGTTESSEGAESVLAANRYRRNSSKETNLNQNSTDNLGACSMSQPTNINLSSSTNNINIVFNSSTASHERNANEVKFINTASRSATTTNDIRLTDYRMPYDCANVSTKSYFDKPLGIDELPKEFEANTAKSAEIGDCRATEGSSSDGQHSSALPSPVQAGASFESFDAPSDHNLISQRGSCQFSSPTSRSPLSPASPACSSLSANAGPSTFVVEPMQHHQSTHHCSYSSYEQDHQTSQAHNQHGQQQHHHHHHHHHEHSPASTTQRSTHTHAHAHTHHHHGHQADDHYQHHHHHHHSHHNANDSFKLSNALKKVRKRARKYTEFLRKK